MNISAILLAMVVVGGTGLLIAILLGIASEKFKVPVTRRKWLSVQNFQEITVVVVDTQVVMDLQKQSQMEKHQSMAVQLVEQQPLKDQCDHGC